MIVFRKCETRPESNNLLKIYIDSLYLEFYYNLEIKNYIPLIL